jgi:putative nucleotidyltransferase with HDIG domain
MEQKQLEELKGWFDDYVAGFYGDDEFINANIKLKDEHTKRTCKETLELAAELGLTDNQRRIADAIALLHDVGRFEQFVKYRTYNDPRSVNHSLLGVEVLRQKKVLEKVDRHERELIEKAIEYHGLRELPGGLEGECLLFSQLIRDADKLDVFYVVTEYYKEYRDNPEEFKLELELPDGPEYSAEVVEEILCGRRIDYGKLRTLNDMKLCQLGWVYDVNFTTTLKRIKQHRFLEKIFDFLPDTEDINKVREKIFEYVDLRIKQDG